MASCPVPWLSCRNLLFRRGYLSFGLLSPLRYLLRPHPDRFPLSFQLPQAGSLPFVRRLFQSYGGRDSSPANGGYNRRDRRYRG